MKSCKYLSLCAFLLIALPALSHSASPAPAPAPAVKPAPDAAAQEMQLSQGQRLFRQNCARCHTEPQGFSPHISGTIMMHMRVRAGLSEKDQKAILRFLNP
jgi:mono/diheme cytochrome c family protein